MVMLLNQNTRRCKKCKLSEKNGDNFLIKIRYITEVFNFPVLLSFSDYNNLRAITLLRTFQFAFLLYTIDGTKR